MNNKLYKMLARMKEKEGLTDELKKKLDVFLLANRITVEQYNELMDIQEESETN